jgi:hypothetical protein
MRLQIQDRPGLGVLVRNVSGAAITVSGSARETNGTKPSVRTPDGLRTVHDWPWTVAAPDTFLTNTPTTVDWLPPG